MDEKEVGSLVFCVCVCGVCEVCVYEYICMGAILSCRYSPCVLNLDLECYRSVPMLRHYVCEIVLCAVRLCFIAFTWTYVNEINPG